MLQFNSQSSDNLNLSKEKSGSDDGLRDGVGSYSKLVKAHIISHMLVEAKEVQTNYHEEFNFRV